VEDHARAARVAKKLTELGFVVVKMVQTNMVWVELKTMGVDCTALFETFSCRGLRTFPGDGTQCRLVFHHEIADEACDLIIAAFEELKTLQK
jgi:threonine aldolase